MLTDSTDGPFDQLSVDDHTLSPYTRNTHHDSLSNTYEVLSDELGRFVCALLCDVCDMFPYRGQYGIVHRCVHKLSGRELAVKYVRLRSKRKSAVRCEVELLRRLCGKSPHLLELVDSFERGRNLIIVTEL